MTLTIFNFNENLYFKKSIINFLNFGSYAYRGDRGDRGPIFIHIEIPEMLFGG